MRFLTLVSFGLQAIAGRCPAPQSDDGALSLIALQGRAQGVEPAFEDSYPSRFGSVRPPRPTPALRSDRDLVLESVPFRAAFQTYGLRKECIASRVFSDSPLAGEARQWR